MKKNNKGFFLAETIIMVALVTTVMAFVFPNLAKLNENYINRTERYDQTRDLYVLMAIYNKNKGTIDNKTSGGIPSSINSSDYSKYTNTSGDSLSSGYSGVGLKYIDNLSTGEIPLSAISKPSGAPGKLYIVSYIETPVVNNDYGFNKYLHRMKKTSNDRCAYRLIGKFESGDNVRYASIKIDNQDPYHICEISGR